MGEFFANAVILASRLHNMVKDKVVPEDATYEEQYQHKRDLQNISHIREIANIGVKKILSNVDCYIDSQEEIKQSLLNGFLKTREAYLRNMNRE